MLLRKFDEEYLTEMKGIADGAADAGAEAWERPIDLRDIVALNSVVDLGQLEDALEVTPNSLTGQAFAAPGNRPRGTNTGRPLRRSARTESRIPGRSCRFRTSPGRTKKN